MYELPRLSRSMRKNTDLDICRNLRPTNEEKFNLQLWRTKESEKGVSWKELNTFIQTNYNKKTSTAIISSLKKLWLLTREMIRTEDNPQIIDDAAIFILRLFLNVKVVMMKHLNQMKIMFGNIGSQKIMKMCSAVSEISPLLNDECRKYLEIVSEDKKSTFLTICGEQISCTIPEPIQYDKHWLQNLSPNLPETSKTAITFSMKYDHKKYIETQQMISEIGFLYTRPWLCKRMNPPVVDNLVELLKSKTSTDELRNDLFELLGFEKHEIIQEIVQNRKEIVEKFEKFELKNHIKNQLLSKQQPKQQEPKVTHIPINFVVQSEEERLLLKQVKKDEKKFNKLINTVQKELDTEEHPEEIDPILLRNFQKQKSLKSTQQIFKHKSLR